MSLPEKIEFALRFQVGASGAAFKRDEEPYQSFDLLRQLRNFLVHYVPERELVWSQSGEHIDQIRKLEKRVSGRFWFLPRDQIAPGDGTKAFVYRVFNKHCARWAFETIDPTLDALSTALRIPRAKLKQHWRFEGPREHT